MTSDDELTRLIDSVKVKPPPYPRPARMEMPQNPVISEHPPQYTPMSSRMMEDLVRKLSEKWGRML